MKLYPTELTANEMKLIAVLKSLHEFEEVVISADKSGQPDTYVVKRSYREIFTVAVE